MQLKGYIYAFISAIFFGMAGILVKNGYSEHFTPVDLLMLQYIIADIILIIICEIKFKNELKLSKKMYKKLFIQGAVWNTLMTVCFYSSFKYLDVAVATMLLYTYPAMVAAASYIFFKQKISKVKIGAITGTFVGCLMVLNMFSGNHKILSPAGITFGILAAVFYSFMNIYAKNIVDNIHPLIVTFYTTTFSLFVLLIFNFKFLYKLPLVTFNSALNAGLLSFFCEIIPLTLLYSAIKYIGPVSTSIISTMELPSSAVMSYIFLGEKLNAFQGAGIIIVIISIIILRRNSK
jgi:drug/metabolite transporter (DMT)-like permease